MRKLISYLMLVYLCAGCAPSPKVINTQLPQAPFRVSGSENATPNYHEGIAWWQTLVEAHRAISIEEFGESDAGYPFHLVLFGEGRSIDEFQRNGKPTLLINNGIHPGEPDGIDASMVMMYDLLDSGDWKDLKSKINIVIIPYYNIGGAINRNSHSRANQDGPEAYGFRGNAQNLDLNRDFIKCDSRNALSFAELIYFLDPDFYVETHVSNGADYSYTLTHLFTQADKLGDPFTDPLREVWIPHILKNTKSRGFETVPYVNVHGTPPDKGYECFYDSPRYSTGFMSLLGIPGVITETHMLKPYAPRVEATLAFLNSCVDLMKDHGADIVTAREEFREAVISQNSFPIDWHVDHSQADSLLFKGYTAKYKSSEISGLDRLYYDKNEPFEKVIPYFGTMEAQEYVEAPEYYILKRGFRQLEERLDANGILLLPIEKDTLMEVEVYSIDTFSTVARAYEGHYGHYDTRVMKTIAKVQLRKGDWMIPLDNEKKRFLVELLEPTGPDSYFNWNFFDAVLQQKEWYSSYVFEDKGAEFLEQNQEIRAEFDKIKKIPPYKDNAQAQLYWVYKQSPHYEEAHLRYPVFRVMPTE